ncbi:MAG: hypothetical protein WCG03_11160 [Kiritimatiellales bacterium]
MSADPFHLNWPVHLARRDVFYIKAVALVKKLPAQKSISEQLKTAEQALYLLREARRHAEAANLSEKTSTQSRLFVSFMDIAVDNTLSITRMIRRQINANALDNPYDGFIGTASTGAKMSGNYRRCGVLILKGLLNILQQSEKPFQALQQTSLAKMTIVDKDRYEKAYKHFEELADGEAERAAEIAS